jgi:hypothetical protein
MLFRSTLFRHIRSDITLSNINEVPDLVKFGSEHEIRLAMNAFPKLVRTWSFSHIRDIQQQAFEQAWTLRANEMYWRTEKKVCIMN